MTFSLGLGGTLEYFPGCRHDSFHGTPLGTVDIQYTIPTNISLINYSPNFAHFTVAAVNVLGKFIIST